MSSEQGRANEHDQDAARQRIVRVGGSRRARLTPAPGSDPEPETPLSRDDDAPAPSGEGTGASGPNDERLRRDVPPHY
ncbi:hypothetical protein [Microbacterium lacticum]|uniref:hypothetical protein n=1 Tax=Microbacterium lacticum TaxID=33885 RepID=UPI0018B03E93|nr:hypothetical protein [Microbacterium lacticum]MBF9336380.1 hypothetical protein [Microbacterium lacticum]